jgi:hypothetical protein
MWRQPAIRLAGRDAEAWTGLGGRSATGEREGKQEPAARGEGAGPKWGWSGLSPSEANARAEGEPLGEADDRLAAGVATEQQADEQRQERHCGQQEGAKLSQGGPG